MSAQTGEEPTAAGESNSPAVKKDPQEPLKKESLLSKEALEFAPGLLSIQEDPPNSLPRVVLILVVCLILITLIWMMVGRIDIVTTAHGVLLPKDYIKIVQPADNGVVEQILVHEDEHVHAGQVLLRMNSSLSGAESAMIKTQLNSDSLKIRRLDAELNGTKLLRQNNDPPDMFNQVVLQLKEHQLAYQAKLMEARDGLRKANEDLASAKQKLIKLEKISPIIHQQASAYAGMGKLGYVPMIDVDNKEKAYLEIQQNILAQRDRVLSLSAAKEQARRNVEDIISKRHSDLRDELLKTEQNYFLMQQKWTEQQYKNGFLELKAPVSGEIQRLATHTVGTVVRPGAILLTLVPDNEPLVAQVNVKNKDVGFVHIGQTVKVKVAAYPFEKFGYLTGIIKNISPDATESSSSSGQSNGGGDNGKKQGANNSYQVMVHLKSQQLTAQGHRFRLIPGMQVSADIVEGRHSVMSYLLSPVQKTIEQSGEGG